MNCLLLSLIFAQALFLANVAAANPYDYNVLGVIASSQDKKGVVLIKNKATGKVNAFREQQEIQPNFHIQKIHRKMVTFVFESKVYNLRVGDEAPTEVQGGSGSGSAMPTDLHKADGIEKNGNTLRVTRALKENLTGENLNKVLMQAAAIPFVENGRLIGFQLLEIDPGSIFDIAGIRNGDIITSINEQPINDAALAIRALNGLKNASTATFGYMRDKQTLELVVQIN